MRFDIVTLFPEIIDVYAKKGVLGKAVDKGILAVHSHDLRPFGEGAYRQVDDSPFGGGAGMVLMFGPIAKCIDTIKSDYKKAGIEKFRVLATTAQGKQFKQSIAKNYVEEIKNSDLQAMIILCGRYEGFDQRILDVLVDDEISMGNYVLTGGELPALTIVDTISRLLPGVLGKEESYQHDSFYEDDETAQYPQYTRPETIEYNGEKLSVPPTLLSGHHAEIEKWREDNKLKD